MDPSLARSSKEELRSLPSVSDLMSTEAGRLIAEALGQRALADWSRAVIAEQRRELLSGKQTMTRAQLITLGAALLLDRLNTERTAELQGVINATGVIIHTNLGRAPLSDQAIDAVTAAARAATVEYDISSGERGKRGGNIDDLIAELTGAEAAVVVNNCAAAALLVLTALASGKDVIVSRGELVEIGGDFRIPEVLELSGCTLREVGTTNRTKLRDYERAIGPNTGMILKVHPSNFRVRGFTSTPTTAELVELAGARDLIFFEDAGSGALIDLAPYGLGEEPLIIRSISEGVDVVSFSGDKLMGGPQSGFIVGKHEPIERIRRHPLYRALRVDKLTYAAIQATMMSFRRERAMEEIPVLKMLSSDSSRLRERAERLLTGITPCAASFNLAVEPTEAVLGGGAAPDVTFPSFAVALTHSTLGPDRIAESLRRSTPPVIARVHEGKVLLDVRTIGESDDENIATAVSDALSSIA
jgi:L-seryl-tRNA(Ser) seleniumtransferase